MTLILFYQQTTAKEFSFNYSLYEHLSRLHAGSGKKDDNLNEKKYQMSIQHVFQATAARNGDVGFVPQMAYLATVLLMFGNEQQVFIILNYLIEEVLPTHFFHKQEKDGLTLGMRFEKLAIEEMFESYTTKLHAKDC